MISILIIFMNYCAIVIFFILNLIIKYFYDSDDSIYVILIFYTVFISLFFHSRFQVILALPPVVQSSLLSLKRLGDLLMNSQNDRNAAPKMKKFIDGIIDVFVIISCPESSLLDTHEYLKPIVTPYEIELAFNTARKFSLFHSIDYKELLPNGVNHINFKSSQESDYSLTSGKIRNSNSVNCSSQQELSPNSSGSVTNNRIGTQLFLSRAWTGLEQKLGESEVKLAVLGRDGIPINYINEKSQN